MTGRVVGATGTAISGAIVTLYYALDGRFHPDVLLRTHTDKSGTFVFPHVEPAKFILAAQPADSAMIFYPSTREPSKTDAIQIEHSTPPPALIIHIRNP